MTGGDTITRGRGRPRKHPIKSPDEKRPRGRPRKDAWVVSAVDQLFKHKGFASLQSALASLVSEYPGMERARTMEFKELKKEVAFKKLVAKARIEIKRRLRRETPDTPIHFPMHVFWILAPISQRRFRQHEPKKGEAKQYRVELREIIEWLDERKAQGKKPAKAKN
ncbi:MAG: hypothetical protein U1E15_04465 [Hyphomicrobiales bacterium]